MGRFKPSVDRAFSDRVTPGYQEFYLARLLESWRETTAQLRRTTILMIGLMVIGVLLTSGDVKEVSVGPIKMADLDVAAKLLPVVIAFLYLDLVLQFFSAMAYNELYADVARKLVPTVYEEGLDVPLAPTLGAMWGGRSILSIGGATPRAATAVNALNILCGATFVLAPLGVLAWEYAQLVGKFGAKDLILWLSLTGTLVCVLRAVAVAEYWRQQAKWGRQSADQERRARLDQA